MFKTFQIVLAGSGGQGIILAAKMFAEAAALYDGKNVAQTQSYGIASRGGYCQAEIIISEEEILHPIVENPDLVMAFTQQGYDLFSGSAKPGSLIIYDQNRVKSRGRSNDIGYPLTSMSVALGNAQVINSLALGIIYQKLQLPSIESLKAMINRYCPPLAVNINLQAFDKGLEA